MSTATASRQELAAQVTATMQKAAPSVFKVSVLGQYVHVLYRAERDRPRIAEMLGVMGYQIAEGVTARDGALIGGELGRVMYGKAAALAKATGNGG